MVISKILLAFTILIVTLFPEQRTQEDPDLPMDQRNRAEIKDRVDFDSAIDGAMERLQSLIEEKTEIKSLPTWFRLRMKQIKTADNRESLSKRVFRFHDAKHLDFFESFDEVELKKTVSIVSETHEVVIDTSKYKSFSRDFLMTSTSGGCFIGKESGTNVVVVSDKPQFPIGVFNSKGELIWETSIFRSLGYSLIEVELFEFNDGFVCYSADDAEVAVQVFSKVDGSTKFWWAAQRKGNAVDAEHKN